MTLHRFVVSLTICFACSSLAGCDAEEVVNAPSSTPSASPPATVEPPELAEAQRERDRVRARLEELEESLVRSEAARPNLEHFVIKRPRFYFAENGNGSRPVIAFGIRNDSEETVSRFYLESVLATPSRAVPWVVDSLPVPVPGGLEPGETREWTLPQPEDSDWALVPQDRNDMILTLQVVRADDPGGQPLYGASFTSDDARQLARLASMFGGAVQSRIDARLGNREDRIKKNISEHQSEQARLRTASAVAQGGESDEDDLPDDPDHRGGQRDSLPPATMSVIEASRTGNIGQIRAHLYWDSEINVADRQGRTPLHYAAEGNHLSIATLLIENGAEILSDKQELTPLHLAVRGNHLPIIQLLLENQADVDTRATLGKWGDDSNLTPAFLALREGHIAALRMLLDADADIDARSTSSGQTLLYYAANGRLHEAAEYLLRRGASVDEGIYREATLGGRHSRSSPLHAAAFNGDVEMVKLLLAHGADPTITDSRGETPLHKAGVREDKPDPDARGVAVAKLLIEHGASLDAEDDRGLTPLDHAKGWSGKSEPFRFARPSRPGVVEFLRDAGFPLHGAVGANRVDEAQRLINEGANLNEGDDRGWTPLHRAMGVEEIEVVRLLLDAGADANAKDNDLLTPLHLAAWEAEADRTDVARLLIENGADVNAKTEAGWTPLHWAASNGHTDLAELLINQGADVNAKLRNGWTPLHRAVEAGHAEVAELLRRHGAEK